MEVTPYYFAPGKMLLQIVVQVSAEPGALGRVIGLLERRVKVIGTTTYGLPDGACVLSAVAEAKSQDMKSKELRDALVSEQGVSDAEVSEGRDGMIVDTYHTGLMVGTEYLVMFRRHAVTRMLDRIHSLLGTGAEVLLFEGGVAQGRSDGEVFVKSLGLGKARRTVDYLMQSLSAQGLGIVTRWATHGDENPVVAIRDCFECASNESGRTGCHFARGYIAGSSSAIFGGEFSVRETECVLETIKKHLDEQRKERKYSEEKVREFIEGRVNETTKERRS